MGEWEKKNRKKKRKERTLPCFPLSAACPFPARKAGAAPAAEAQEVRCLCKDVQELFFALASSPCLRGETAGTRPSRWRAEGVHCRGNLRLSSSANQVPIPGFPVSLRPMGPNRQGLGEAFGCTGRRNPRSASPLNQRATFRGCKHLREDGVQFSGVTRTVEAAGRGPRSPRLGVRCC